MNDQYEYDYIREADILEIFFERGTATCAVEITDHITLRFRPEEQKAMSLILDNVSYLVKPAEIGPRSFRLKLECISPELRQTVIELITSAPVNQFLKVSSYTRPRARRFEPITYVERLPALALAQGQVA
jgi:hypothetical protein